MDRTHESGPQWKAPASLLPRVLAATRESTLTETRPGIVSIIIVPGVCVAVGLGLAALLGLLPQPGVYVELFVNHLMAASRALSVLEHGLAIVMQAMISDVRTLALIALYCGLVFPIAFGGVGGIVLLARMDAQQRRV